MSSEFMLNQSLASDGHGISDETWGSLKADLPYCQTMTFKYCNVPSSSSASVKLGCESTNVQALPGKSPCKGYGQKTPKQKFGLFLNWLIITSVNSTALGDKCCHTGRTLYPAHAVQHSITPLTSANGAKGTQASYTSQRHRSIQVFLIVARK